MALKWFSAIVAASTMAAFITANVIASDRIQVWVNLGLAATCAGSMVLVVMAECYQRLDSRLGAMSDYMVNRLDEISGQLTVLEDRRNTERRLEAILTEPEHPVVPLLPRRTGR